MWPATVDWVDLRFGVEIEFVGGHPAAVALLPGWRMALDEQHCDEDGRASGGELTPPPLGWAERGQIREMLARLRQAGARAIWSCGLHVHVGLEPWGQDAVLPLVDAALAYQQALRDLLQTPAHRMVYCPPITPAMRAAYAAQPGRPALVHRGRPQSHRCGINAAAWFDFGTVEIRFANGTLVYAEVERTVELCLRFVAAVGAGRVLPASAGALAAALGAPADGYPPPQPAPLWHEERTWLEAALMPALAPLALAAVPDGEVLHIRPVPAGIQVAMERTGGAVARLLFRWGPGGWHLVSTAPP